MSCLEGHIWLQSFLKQARSEVHHAVPCELYTWNWRCKQHFKHPWILQLNFNVGLKTWKASCLVCWLTSTTLLTEERLQSAGRLNATAVFSSPVGNISLPLPPLWAWCFYGITNMRGLLLFSEANPTWDFYPISMLYWSGWEGSHSISKCERSQSKLVTAPPTQTCHKLSRLPSKCWVPFTAVNPQLRQHWLSDQSHTHTAQLCNVTQTACHHAVLQGHRCLTELPSATAHHTAPLRCHHNSRASFLTLLAFKTKHYYFCLLVWLLVNPFKNATGCWS